MITDSFEIFCDKYHKRQHLSDDLIKYIMNINTLQIKEEHKEKHKQLFMNDFIRFMDVRLSNMRYEGNLDENEITEYLLRDRNEDMWNEDEWMYERWGCNIKIYVEDDIIYDYLHHGCIY